MKNIARSIILIVFMVSSLSVVYSADIIPKPAKYTTNGETFILTQGVKILYDGDLKAQADLLEAALSPATGWDFEVNKSTSAKKGSILLKVDASLNLPKSGYKMAITGKSIVITASDPAGIFYGTQTLLQLLPAEIFSALRQKDVAWKIEGAEIEDWPQYEWRGIMLDVSRYFFDKEYVEKFMDMMAMYKMNILHLHLIDDAGWRLEIKKYPKLTSVGAWRGEGVERTGGYYTQEDIKEMVEYGKLRNIEIIPEIEIPAHTLAAISAYPWLSCTGEKHKVPTYHFISRDLYCVGRESTFEFLDDVFKETFALFPSKYIHIGGDEAKYGRWKKCDHCQKRKKDLGLKSEAELQVYFNRRIQQMVKKYGKTIVGWDEIIEDGLKDKAVGMVWYNKKKAAIAVEMGHDVVMALTDYCYFDVAESSIPGEVKAATWLRPISLPKVYQFNPMIKSIDKKYRSNVLGGEACLWSDQFIHGTILQEIALLNETRSEKYFDYLAFPRTAALAEVLWSPVEVQDWDDFEQRMSTHYNRYDLIGTGYRIPQPKLAGKSEDQGMYTIELANVVNGAHICYTTNGVRPDVHSTVYTEPVKVKRLQDFQAITVVNSRQYSLPLYFPVNYPKLKEYGKLIKELRPWDMSSDKTDYVEINATGKINKNRKYTVSFWLTDGDGTIEIESVGLYKNGKLIDEDKHTGIAGAKSEDNLYRFDVSQYETGAGFTLKAKVRASSEDIYGVVFIK